MSTLSSAQREIDPDDPFPASDPLPPFELTGPAPAFRRDAAERVAAHRARRGFPSPPQTPLESPAPGPSRPSRVRSARIAAAVAERYAQSPTYRSFLAAEAERAVHQAEAAAQVATINAQAIADAQQQLLDDLDNWSLAPAEAGRPGAIATVPLHPVDYDALFDREFAPSASAAYRETEPYPLAPVEQTPPAVLPRLTVQPFAGNQYTVSDLAGQDPANRRSPTFHQELDGDEEERLALEDEIAFRHHPIFEELSEQVPIAANLIEFPRQLVAARRARPRLAEGPLREEDPQAGGRSQLRIFEVEPEHLNSAPASDNAAPEWSSILLSALPAAEFLEAADYLAASVPQAASLGRRLKAALADAALILAAQAAFLTVFHVAVTQLTGDRTLFEIPRPLAAAGLLATLAVFALLYQLLFFTFSDATPGMRFARIGLCTFSDENPTRSAMRRRIIATLLAAFPLGIGLLWAFLDEDTLGWHDRISRMYQRAY